MSAAATSTDTLQRRVAALEQQEVKLQKINRALMDRVERSVDMQGNQFSLFETAILLESTVAERTAALQTALDALEYKNQELAAAKAEAEEANRSKTRFLAAASHDLLQPLNAARLFVSALAETEQPPSNRHLIRNIDAAFESFEGLLKDLLDMSKLDAGVLKPEVQSLPLNTLFRQLETEFRPLAEERGLRFTVVPSRVVVRTDIKLLARVVRNLLNNALHYTNKGRILLGCRHRPEGLMVEVHDTGIGIPKEQQEAIFNEFQRLEAGVRQSSGHGLGLAIVKRIGRVLDHPLGVRSKLGAGSCFHILVPYGDANAYCPTKTVLGSGKHPAGAFAGHTLLVIDNEVTILEGMRVLLTGWGCEVLTATSATGAVRAVERAQHVPDLIIADYHLDHDEIGTNAIEHVRQHVRDPNLPGMVVTADRTPEIMSELGLLELTVLHKPVRPAKLRSLLNYLLKNHQTVGGRDFSTDH